MTVCIRRAGATWTTCTCDPCVIRRRRVRKANDLGLVPPARTDEAWEVLDGWIAQKWSATAIASATGLRPRWVHYIVTARRDGHRAALTRPTVNRILTNRYARPTAGHITALGATRRLQALTAMGHTLADIHDVTGLPQMTLSVIRSGGVEVTSPSNHDAITAAFRQLAMRPGRSNRSRLVAAKHGWAPPLAWDDIDDPTEHPTTGRVPDGIDHVAVDLAVTGARTVRLTVPERHLAVRRLAERGLNDTEIAARVGVTAKTVLLDRQELGIPSQWKATA